MKFYAIVIMVWLTVMFTDSKAGFIDDYQGYQFGDLGFSDVHSRWTDEGFNQISKTHYKSTGSGQGSTTRYMRFHKDETPALDWFYSNSSFLISWDSPVKSIGIDISSHYSDRQYTAFVTYGDNQVDNFLLPFEENPRITSVFWGIESDLGIKSIHFGDPNGQIRPQGFNALGIDNLIVGDWVVIPTPTTLGLFLIGLLGMRKWLVTSNY